MSFEKSAEWMSSKGARSIQFIKTFVTVQTEAPDVHHQFFITLRQRCIGKSASISIALREANPGLIVTGTKIHFASTNTTERNVFIIAENPYVGISLKPNEWAQIQQAMQELSP